MEERGEQELGGGGEAWGNGWIGKTQKCRIEVIRRRHGVAGNRLGWGLAAVLKLNVVVQGQPHSYIYIYIYYIYPLYIDRVMIHSSNSQRRLHEVGGR